MKSKKSNKPTIYTQRVLELIEEYRADFGATYEEVYTIIGSTRNNHANYKKGLTDFTVPQIIKCAQKMNVSIDWICGLSNDRSPRKDIHPMVKLKQAVKELDQLISSK